MGTPPRIAFGSEVRTSAFEERKSRSWPSCWYEMTVAPYTVACSHQEVGPVGQSADMFSQPFGDQRATRWTHRVLTLRATTTLDEPSERVTVSDDGAIDTARADGGGRRSVARREDYAH